MCIKILPSPKSQLSEIKKSCFIKNLKFDVQSMNTCLPYFTLSITPFKSFE